MFMGFVSEDDDFDAAWRTAEPLLERSLPYSTTGTLDELKEDFYNRRRLLWLIGEDDTIYAACMSSVTEDGTLMIENCGGESVDKWLPEVWKTFQRYAELSDLNQLKIVGRKGWLKLLRQYGDIDYQDLAVFTSRPEYLKVH